MKSSKKLDEIKCLLPFYLKGIDLGKKSEELEKFLNEEEIKDDLKFWRVVNMGYNIIKGDLPEPEKNLFPKIIYRIRKKKAEQKRLVNIFKLIPRHSLVLLLVQLLVIIGLVLYILNLRYEFKTLSIRDTRAETSVTINVVFNENAKESEIRKLLRSVDGRIIDGPSVTGLYIISIKDPEKKEVVLEILKKSEIVFFAEPTP